MAPQAEPTVPTQQESEVSTQREGTREPERYVTPPVDIYETEDGLTILVDIPGVSKENLNISVEDDILSIEGKVPATEQDTDYEWAEYRLNNYWRQFQLSSAVDREKIEAKLENGVLNLYLPKAEKAKPRKLEVRTE